MLLHQVPFPWDTVAYGPLRTLFRRPDAWDERKYTSVGPFVDEKVPVLKPVHPLTLLRLRDMTRLYLPTLPLMVAP